MMGFAGDYLTPFTLFICWFFEEYSGASVNVQIPVPLSRLTCA